MGEAAQKEVLTLGGGGKEGKQKEKQPRNRIETWDIMQNLDFSLAKESYQLSLNHSFTYFQ